MSTEPLNPSYTRTEHEGKMSRESSEFLREYKGLTGSASTSKLVAVLCLVVALLGKICVGTGVALLIYTIGLEFPLASASGIWTGVIVMAAGYLGLLLYWKNAFSGSPDVNLIRRRSVAFHYALVIISLCLTILHVVYSLWGLEICSNQENTCFQHVLRDDIKTIEVGCFCVAVVSVLVLAFIVGVIGRWMKRSGVGRGGRIGVESTYDTL